MTAAQRTGALAALAAGALLASLPARAGPGDPVAGAETYQRCLACHTLAANLVGPRHCGLLGRRAGSEPDFDYSDAMRQSGLVWTEETLDRFLSNPAALVPGTRMTYAGVPEPRERRDLIAYLKAATRDPALCGNATPEPESKAQ